MKKFIGVMVELLSIHLRGGKQMNKTFLKNTALCVGLSFVGIALAQAQGRLTFYCTVQNDTCEKISQAFAKKYQVETKFLTAPTGTILGRLEAEKNNPQADVWYGGTIDYHLQAREMGLLEPYRSPKIDEMTPQLQKMLKNYTDYTGIVSLMVLGIGVNTEKMKALGIKDYPQCWKDLLDPRLKGQVQIPNPQSSGSSYSFMANLIQLWGEDKAFDYLKKLHQQIPNYVSSTMVTNNLARGDVAVSMGFIHSYAKLKEQGVPLDIILPCEGNSYSLDAVSIMKNARNLSNSKLFMDFVLGKEGQEIPWKEAKVYQVPVNVNAEVSPLSVDPQKLNLLEFDFKRFGSKAEGKRIVDKWVKEVKMEK